MVGTDNISVINRNTHEDMELINGLNSHGESDSMLLVQLQWENKVVKFLVDTRAPVSEADYELYSSNYKHNHLQKTNRMLRGETSACLLVFKLSYLKLYVEHYL